MRSWALEVLRCPVTNAPLELKDPIFEGDHVMTGQLVSPEGRSYPILGGVPRLIVGYQSQAERQTVQAFGTEWKEFHTSQGFMGSEELFFQFLQGLQPSDFKDKIVLEAGCGNGRWVKIMHFFGCERIVALDYSEAVEPCFANTHQLENVLVVQGSIYALPLPQSYFDLVVSIGVIHHLDQPTRGVEQLARVICSAGKLAFWVYAYEGNELYLKLVTPLRRIGPRLGQKKLLALARCLALPVWVHAHTLSHWMGLRRDGSPRLPLAEYFRLLSKLRYQDIVNVVYDQLTPQLAVYSREEEVRQWLMASHLEIESLRLRTGNSWSALVRKPKN